MPFRQGVPVEGMKIRCVPLLPQGRLGQMRGVRNVVVPYLEGLFRTALSNDEQRGERGVA